jgi:hypothetical protein
MDHSEIEKIAKKKQLKASVKVKNKETPTDKKRCRTAKSGRKLIPGQLIKVQEDPAKSIAKTAKKTIAAAKKREQVAA